MLSNTTGGRSPLRINQRSQTGQWGSQEPRRKNTGDQENTSAPPTMEGYNKIGADQAKSKNVSPQRDGSPRACPQTPANRIPLADLVGNTEDAYDRPAADITPDDQVFWQTGPRSSDPSNSASSQRRSKKRAHSSSPAASHIQKSNKTIPADLSGSFDLQNLHQYLKTPQMDPALDLWNRYADTGEAKQDEGRTLSAFANLGSSSPQTPGTTSSKKGFRKAFSCGVEWPMSKPKRMRLDQSYTLHKAEETLAQTKEDILSTKTSASSKVNLLMEKIQESLINQPRVAVRHPSSSSPLPERTRVFDDMAALCDIEESHEQREVGTKDTKNGDVQQPEDPQQESLQEKSKTDDGSDISRIVSKDSSSDYGDDVFDDDFLDCAPEKTLQSGQETKGGDGDVTFGAADFEDLVAAIDADAEGSQIEPPISGTILKKPPIDGDDVEDAFGDDNDEDLWNEVSGVMTLEEGQSQMATKCSKGDQSLTRQAIKRYLIVDVADGHYEDAKGKQRPERVLSVKDEKTRDIKVILLRQCWLETRAMKGTYVHLIGQFDRRGHCVVDDAENLIIVHPDFLISATGVSDSFQCLRRSILADRVKATSDPNPAQVYGSILHELFQEALKVNCWELPWLDTTLQRIVLEFLEALYQINVPISDAMEHLRSKMPELRAWATQFISANPQPNAFALERNGLRVNLGINRLLEVEEHVWSPMYGLKGNIDATVQVTVNDSLSGAQRTLTVPLELKTGKRDTSEAHRAQTALYTLLLQDRYDVDVLFGLLYYIDTSKVFSIPAIRNEIRHMIVQRNEIASYVHSKLDLPPMVRKPHMCNSCYAKSACWTYHRLKENGDGQSSGLAEKFDQAVAHLTKTDQEWFTKWDDLITKEEKDMMKFRRELWTMQSSERERLGRCFGSVIIEPGSAQVNTNRAKIDRYRYTFIKKMIQPEFSFTESQLTLGEPIVVSDEEGHFALAMGYITNVQRDRISVAVDRRLHNVRTKGANFHAVTNQTFRGIMDVEVGNRVPTQDEESVVYRVDKDEFNSGLATIRNNLIRMMEKDLFRARELRQLIINGVAPMFKPTSSAYTLHETSSQQLNIDQKRAIEKVMSAQDYALVLGMPGTGKTTTIAHIIRALVMQGKTVLLNSYTHTAVDNILLKIKEDDIKIFRIGSLGKIHPEVQAFAELAAVPKKTVEELQDCYINSQVVATTCLGVNHPIFNQRIFDYCIVDEASQITLPTCLSGLRMAKTFVLVGDHYQLPPLVQNKEAQEGGLDISLFKILSDKHPESVVNLEHQYRMNADIMSLSNALIYSGRLKCGTQTVAGRRLLIPNLDTGLSFQHLTELNALSGGTPNSICTNDRSCWIRQSLDPQRPVVFLNTDRIDSEASEITRGPRITNEGEALLTIQLVTTLIASGIAPREIGVITFYRSQLALLRQWLGSQYSEVEMHTADKFQGRDKEVVILSCVRSNDSGSIGDLLKDWRRVNVALTRARSKMLIIGSRLTLAKSQNDVLEHFVELLESKNWVLDLPPHSLKGHVIGPASQMHSRLHGSKSKNKAGHSPSKSISPAKAVKLNSSPLAEIKGNSQKKKMEGMRQPAKVGKGINVERLLETRPLINDIMNDVA